MYLVNKIIEKCEHSHKDWRRGVTGSRTLKIEESDYMECGKSELLNEAKFLEKAELISIKKWIVYDSDIDSISFKVEALDDFYNIKSREDGEHYIPKRDKIEYLLSKVEDELDEDYKNQWIDKYMEDLKNRLTNGEIPRGIGKIDIILKCLRGLDNLEVPMLKRVFSKKYLKDSKVFEKELEKIILTIARKFNEDVTEDMDTKTVLEQLMIEEYSQVLEVKGPLKIKIWKGAEARRVDLCDFIYGVVLNSQTLKHALVELEQPALRKVVTVENKANYMAMEYEPDTLYIFSHGYFSPLEREFLRKLGRAVAGKGVEFYHSGDLDYGGVKIYEYIKKSIFPELKPMWMDVDTYNKYEEYATPIAPETLEKLEKVNIPDLNDLVKRMLENKKGIEQEIFLAE